MLSNSYFLRNHQKTIGFLIISGGLEVKFAEICLILQSKFEDDPMCYTYVLHNVVHVLVTYTPVINNFNIRS